MNGKPKPMTDSECMTALETLRGFEKPTERDPLAWARRLRFRELSYERLTPYQRNAWREALHSVEKPDTPYESTP